MEKPFLNICMHVQLFVSKVNFLNDIQKELCEVNVGQELNSVCTFLHRECYRHEVNYFRVEDKFYYNIMWSDIFSQPG